MYKFNKVKIKNKLGIVNQNYNSKNLENIKNEKIKEFDRDFKIKMDTEKYKNRFTELLKDIKKEEQKEEQEIIIDDISFTDIYIDNSEIVINKDYIEPKMKGIVNLAINKFIKKTDNW